MQRVCLTGCSYFHLNRLNCCWKLRHLISTCQWQKIPRAAKSAWCFLQKSDPQASVQVELLNVQLHFFGLTLWWIVFMTNSKHAIVQKPGCPMSAVSVRRLTSMHTTHRWRCATAQSLCPSGHSLPPSEIAKYWRPLFWVTHWETSCSLRMWNQCSLQQWSVDKSASVHGRAHTGSHVTWSTESECPLSSSSDLCSLRNPVWSNTQTLAVWSTLPLASFRPVQLHATLCTFFLCPINSLVRATLKCSASLRVMLLQRMHAEDGSGMLLPELVVS